MTFVTKSNGKNKDTFNPNDKIYTPEHIAKMIIGMFPIAGKVLDPFRGGGIFYSNFPECADKEWCEIDDGKDFYDYKEKVNWIISNPPYSDFTRVMQHSYELADNIVYLIPLNKIVSSWGRVKDLEEYGGIVSLYILPAGKCGFPFGFPACVVHIKRGYKGNIQWIVEPKA
jgi:hypothetical protein